MSEGKKKPADDGDDMPSSPAWMATFSDMMTLLMCFFILILSFSSMEVDKFKLAMGSLQGAMGVLGVQKSLMPNQSWFSPSTASSFTMKERGVLEHMSKMSSVIDKNDLQDKVSVKMGDGEVAIEINDGMLFKAGEAQLQPNFVKLLSIVSTLFFKDAVKINIEGHTDDIPIKTEKFPSNWDLSVARALSVLRYFTEVDKIDPSKFSAQGYAEHKPLVLNNSPANRAKNRRVTIRVKI